MRKIIVSIFLVLTFLCSLAMSETCQREMKRNPPVFMILL